MLDLRKNGPNLALTKGAPLSGKTELHRAERRKSRHRLLHTAARITRGQGRVFLRLADHWPCALAFAKTHRLRQILLSA